MATQPLAMNTRPSGTGAGWALFWIAVIPLIAWIPLLGLDAYQASLLRQEGLRPDPMRRPRDAAATPPESTSAAVRDGTRSLQHALELPSDPIPPAFDSAAANSAKATDNSESVSVSASLSAPIRLSPRLISNIHQPAQPPLVLEQLPIYPRRPPSGALLLGPLDLSSLNERPMLPAARIERAHQLASPDPLSVVPKAWKQALASSIRSSDRVIPAEIVRLPAPHLSAPEQIPVILRHGARADSPAAPPSARSLSLLNNWVQRQPGVAKGSVRPVLLELEPLPAGAAPATASAARSRPQPSTILPSNNAGPSAAPTASLRIAPATTPARVAPLSPASSDAASRGVPSAIPAAAPIASPEPAAPAPAPAPQASAPVSPAAPAGAEQPGAAAL